MDYDFEDIFSQIPQINPQQQEQPKQAAPQVQALDFAQQPETEAPAKEETEKKGKKFNIKLPKDKIKKPDFKKPDFKKPDLASLKNIDKNNLDWKLIGMVAAMVVAVIAILIAFGATGGEYNDIKGYIDTQAHYSGVDVSALSCKFSDKYKYTDANALTHRAQYEIYTCEISKDENVYYAIVSAKYVDGTYTYNISHMFSKDEKKVMKAYLKETTNSLKDYSDVFGLALFGNSVSASDTSVDEYTQFTTATYNIETNYSAYVCGRVFGTVEEFIVSHF